MKYLLFSAASVLALDAVSAQIGQSQPEGQEPIRWYGCAWCVADRNDNVYLPDGWMIPRGRRSAVRMAKRVSGRLLSDGANLFQWIPDRASMTRVLAVDGGLEQGSLLFRTDNWDMRFSVIPSGLATGFAAKGKFLAYDASAQHITAYAEDGAPRGVVFDVGRVCRGRKIQTFAIHPKTGDILLQTAYPDCHLRRFQADGSEVCDEVWPRSFLASGFSVYGGDLYAVREGAFLIDNVLSDRKGQIGDERAFETFCMAWGGEGWWLATTQGALYYPKDYPTTCTKRLGGVTDVTALAVSPEGMIVASAGCHIYAFMLDDDRDELPLSSESWMWYLGGGWSDARVSAIQWRDGLFFFRDEKNARTWALNPKETNGAHRNRRMFLTNETVSATSAVATPNGWQVAYDERRYAIVRSRVEQTTKKERK